MSSTLFRYIFRDLLRIFLLTSAALAGIMSFGGLLRPLTEHGLDASQAAKMLSFFMPAMTTYSLPIAALFATTVVANSAAIGSEYVDIAGMKNDSIFAACPASRPCSVNGRSSPPKLMMPASAPLVRRKMRSRSLKM